MMIPRNDSRITITGISLKFLIEFTYGSEQALPPDLVVGRAVMV